MAAAGSAEARGFAAGAERGRGSATCAGSAGLRSCALLSARRRRRCSAFESANSAACQPARPLVPDSPEEPRVSDRRRAGEVSPAPPGWGGASRLPLPSRRLGALPGAPRCRSLRAGKRFGSPGIGAGELPPFQLRWAGEEEMVVCQGRAWNVLIHGFSGKKRRGWGRGGILDAGKSAVAPYTRPGWMGMFLFMKR